MRFRGCGLRILGVVAACVLAAGADELPPPMPVRTETEPGRLPASVTAKRSGQLWACTFRHKPAGPVARVNLVGTFTGWNRGQGAMKGPEADGTWTIETMLEDGVHQYKFLEDGERWVADPANGDRMDDNHGGKNSVLRLGPFAWLKESNAKVGDGVLEAFEHRPEQTLYFQAVSPTRALIRCRLLSHDAERVEVVERGAGEVEKPKRVEMRAIAVDPLATLYEAEIDTRPMLMASLDLAVRYAFIITDGPVTGTLEGYQGRFQDRTMLVTPEWARDVVWYQIMVDRFRNGEAGNDPDPVRPWRSEWFTASAWETASGETFYKYFVYQRLYGGDIAGLEEKLDYLADLGVNALYLNPVFKAESHHKYDALDYAHIDDHFGTKGDFEAAISTENPLDPKTWTWTASDRRFLEFLKVAKSKGFRVIIDGVFNHIGKKNRIFQDVVKHGTRSPYADWFEIESWEPFKYKGWAGVDNLPEFRKDIEHGIASKAAREYIFAVTRRWMDPDGDGDPSDGIDGWRLDVPNEVPMAFWIEWRRLVKSINAEAYISGEIWERADAWLDGRTFDAVMNYPFAQVVLDWIIQKEKKITPTAADRRLRELRLAYPHAATYVMQNLVDSHDTDRLVSMVHNPDRAYDAENRVQDNGPNYRNSKPTEAEYRRARLVAFFQMTYVGAPMVYYGDEAGMWGADDPTCRKPMLWKDLEPYEKPEENFVMEDHLDFYRRAMKLRREHAALRRGRFETLRTDDSQDAWVFLREHEEEKLIVAMCAGEHEARVTIALPPGWPKNWKVIFGGTGEATAKEEKLPIVIPAVGGVVLKP